MQHPMNTNPVQVVVLAQPALLDNQNIYKNMNNGLARQLIASGGLQLLIGILSIIFQAISLGMSVNGGYIYYTFDFTGCGFWTGLMIITFNVLSVIATAFAACLFSLAVRSAVINANRCRHFYDNYYSSGYNCYMTDEQKKGIAMAALMAILAVIEGIIDIWSSVVCCTIGACCCRCGGSCCCPRSPYQNQFLMRGQPFPGEQQILIATQQQSSSIQQPQMFIPNQPLAFQPNSQQPMFQYNPQPPIFATCPPQPIINLDPQQQMVQYNPQQLNPPPYNQLLT